MDDIRVYETDEEKLTHALVIIDRHLKGCGLSLNSKKTSVETIAKDREDEKKNPLSDYETDEDAAEKNKYKKRAFVLRDVLSENANADLNDQNPQLMDEDLSDDDLILLCIKELGEIEKKAEQLYATIGKGNGLALFLNSDNQQRDFINYAYRWRTAMSILKEFKLEAKASKDLIDVWLFGISHLFWKANHFVWNLNQYGANVYIKHELMKLFKRFDYFEWVQYQILSNMATVQPFDEKELRRFAGLLDKEESVLVRLGIYKLLIKNVRVENDLYASIRQCLSKEKEPYLKHVLLLGDNNTLKLTGDITKNWLGL
jgi:hypothetical protein